MCGITGIFHLDGQAVDAHALRSMADALRHRGPDDEGYALFNPASGESLHLKGPDSPNGVALSTISQFSILNSSFSVALAERRLAILDLSPAGHTPMTTPDGALTISFNGEIYNFIELRAELRAHGHAFRTSGDTEVLLAAYREWGEQCVTRFNGMWAFALWDAPRRKLFCSRDRFGVKPFYYTHDGHTFTFASEPKALFAGGHIAPTPNATVLMDFLAGYEASDATACMYDKVQQLPGGHSLVIEEGKLRVQRYWSLPVNPDIGPATLDMRKIDELRALLTDAVRLRLRSDVPVGTCLSGGLDSSAIVVLMNTLMRDEHNIAQELAGEHQKTFTACYDDAEADERTFAEMIVRQTNAQWHKTFPSAEGLLADLDRFIWHHDEPPITSSIYAQWCVMRAVREGGVTVTLDGQGSDELLAGYLPYEVYWSQLLRGGQIGRLVGEARATAQVGSRPVADIAKRALAYQLPILVQRRMQAGRRERMLGLSHETVSAAIERHARNFDGDTKVNLPKHLHALTMNNLPRLLRVEDRNSMAFSVESRTPFLDVRLAEFISQLPASYRIHQGWTKFALRKALDGILPKEITWRRDKKGFATPERAWMRALRPRIQAMFHDAPRTVGLLDMDVVRRTVANDDFANDRLASASAWRWFAAELWLRMIEARNDAGYS